MKGYITVERQSEFRLVEKKSEFIGYCSPVTTEEEATAFVRAIKKKHSDARHNVYAYVLRENNTSRFSDDGEPHGTAGMPVLDSIRKAGLTDTAVVVTRYFGGILLGTGGLVRAYTAAAVGAIGEARVAEVGVFSVYSLDLSYPDYQRVMPVISAFGGRTVDSDFGDRVHIRVMLANELGEKFSAEITGATSGRTNAVFCEQKYDFLPKTD